MANIVDVECKNLVNAWLGIAAYTPVTGSMKLRLYVSGTTASAAGTEVTNGGGSTYAEQVIVFSTPTTAAPSLTSNTAIISFANMPAITTAFINIFDSTGTPVRRAYGSLTVSKTTGLGDTLSFAAASIQAQIG